VVGVGHRDHSGLQSRVDWPSVEALSRRCPPAKAALPRAPWTRSLRGARNGGVTSPGQPGQLGRPRRPPKPSRQAEQAGGGQTRRSRAGARRRRPGSLPGSCRLCSTDGPYARTSRRTWARSPCRYGLRSRSGEDARSSNVVGSGTQHFFCLSSAVVGLRRTAPFRSEAAAGQRGRRAVDELGGAGYWQLRAGADPHARVTRPAQDADFPRRQPAGSPQEARAIHQGASRVVLGRRRWRATPPPAASTPRTCSWPSSRDRGRRTAPSGRPESTSDPRRVDAGVDIDLLRTALEDQRAAA
jgi:hypothetical protein